MQPPNMPERPEIRLTGGNPSKSIIRGINRYGLDVNYFNNLIKSEFSILENYRPDEFARVCARMAKTACKEVLQEKEFQTGGDQ